MADVVNLRRARKAKQRAERDAAAEANRQAFGRTKPERRASDLAAALAERTFQGHRRERPDGGNA